MMEACVEYDFPEGAVPEMPEVRCYTVDDLMVILQCGRRAVYELLKRKEFRYSNTNLSNTDMSKTENPILSGWDADGMAERRTCEDYFWRSLEYDKLLHDNPNEMETLEGILDLLVDTCCSGRKYIRIAGDDKPKEVVKSRFMKLDSMHIQYVLSCLKEGTADVRNIKQYLLAALYNAPMTISPYYQAKVNYDLYGNHT